MKTPISIIEDWWRHNGCYDREQASSIPYDVDCTILEVADYYNETDNWWERLTDSEKQEIYNQFFSEE